MKGTLSMIAVGLLAAGLAATGFSASNRPSSVLRADVAEWSIVPSSGVVRAGDVSIVVHNLGAQAHQLMIVRTRSFAQQLPLRGDRALVRPIASTLAAPGATVRFVVHLHRGSYVLLDNLPWHYWKGTRAAFVVS